LFFSSRRRHTRSKRDWSSDVCSSDLFLSRLGVLFTPSLLISSTLLIRSDLLKTKRDRLLYLHYLPSMTRRYLYKIKKTDPEWQHIFSHTPQELSTRLQLPIHKAVTLYKEIQNTTYYLSQLQHNLRRMKTVTIYDKIYPDILKNIPDSPLILYVLGDTSLLNQQKSISVIGTRKPSSEAFSKLQHIVAPLLEDEW